MSTVPFEVVTPDKFVLSTEVNMVSVRGGDGELGILPRHMALATTVKPGIVRVKLPAGEDYIAVTGGFLEVLPTRITILAETAETARDIDAARARAAKERAENRLNQRSEDIDVLRAEAALERATRRLEVIEMSARGGNIFNTLD